MAQKDYVRRGRTTSRKNKHAGKKKSNQGLPKTTLAAAIVIVVIFIGSLYYITQNKGVPVLNRASSPNINQPASSLPPKPEERWRYIKELEKRGTDLPDFNRSPKSNINNTTELTHEQRQLLEQIDADRRGTITNLSEVPNNDNVPRSRVIINGPPIESPLRLKPEPQSKQPTNSEQKILVQCGSCKSLEQAESIKANLAFSGLESRISSAEGWHRVVLGPYSKEAAEKIRDRANSVGISGCILRTNKG